MLKRLTEYLDRNHIKYVVMSHSQAYTASEIAAISHLPGKELAKTVMIKADGSMSMLVLPASYMVDFGILRKALQVNEVRLATEAEFKELFPECEVGAMPPFGNLFGMDVVVDRGLTGTHEIAFNAGNHKELLRMAYQDFERLVRPRILTFGIVRKSREDEVDVMP
jgi:Ala-tRNA(Pro) deacylase